MVDGSERRPPPVAVLPAAGTRSRLLAWAAVLAAVTVLYLPGLDNFFAGDAFSWLYNAARTVNDPGLFLGAQSNFVRHGAALYVILTYLVAGFSYPAFLGVALAIHLGNVLLVGRLALRSGAGEAGAVLAALLWGVNYRISEAVFHLYAVADPLALLFGLAALLLFIRGRSVAAAPLLLVALFCKENALMFPAVAVVWALLFVDSSHRRRRLLETLPMWSAAAVFTPLMLTLRQPSYLDVSWSALPRFFELVLSYVGPDATYLEQEVLKTGGPLIPVWLAALLLVAAAAAVWRLPTRYRFGVLWIPITVLPTLFVPFQTSRYHYVPLVGVALVVGVTATDILHRARTARSRWWLLPAAAVFLLYVGHAAWGMAVEEHDYGLIGELHREAADSFLRDALPVMLSHPERVTVFIRDDTMVWADRLLAAYGGRPWYWPTTYKWIYRRPWGIGGLADTYGFVTYCAAVEGDVDPPLFEPVSRGELTTALAVHQVQAVVYEAATNRFGIAPPRVLDELASRPLTAGMAMSLQPGRFRPGSVHRTRPQPGRPDSGRTASGREGTRRRGGPT